MLSRTPKVIRLLLVVPQGKRLLGTIMVNRSEGDLVLQRGSYSRYCTHNEVSIYHLKERPGDMILLLSGMLEKTKEIKFVETPEEPSL
jgi:hypothetical protein